MPPSRPATRSVPHRRRTGPGSLPRPGRQLRRPRDRPAATRRAGPGRRDWLRALDATGTQLLVPVRGRRLRTTQPRARQPTGPSTSGAASHPSTPPPSPCWTASRTTPPSWSPTASRSVCARPEPEEVPAQPLIQSLGWGHFVATSGTSTWPLTLTGVDVSRSRRAANRRAYSAVGWDGERQVAKLALRSHFLTDV